MLLLLLHPQAASGEPDAPGSGAAHPAGIERGRPPSPGSDGHLQSVPDSIRSSDLVVVGSQNHKLFGPLKSAQSPKYMVFACSDSRVCPSVTLDLKPREAFTACNIASLVPAYHQNMHSSVASAIEFAVTILKEAVNLSLRNLKTYPFVKDKVAKGTLKLIGARYDFVHGSFQTWHA